MIKFMSAAERIEYETPRVVTFGSGMMGGKLPLQRITLGTHIKVRIMALDVGYEPGKFEAVYEIGEVVPQSEEDVLRWKKKVAKALARQEWIEGGEVGPDPYDE